MKDTDLTVKGVKCPFCGDKEDKLKSWFSTLLYCSKCISGWFP